MSYHVLETFIREVLETSCQTNLDLLAHTSLMLGRFPTSHVEWIERIDLVLRLATTYVSSPIIFDQLKFYHMFAMQILVRDQALMTALVVSQYISDALFVLLGPTLFWRVMNLVYLVVEGKIV